MQNLYHIYLSHLLTIFRTWQSSQPSQPSHLSHLSHFSQPSQSSQPFQLFQKKFLLYLPFTLDTGRIQDHRRITERWAKYKHLIISFVLPNLSNRQIVKLTNYHYLCTKNIHFFKWHKCQPFTYFCRIPARGRQTAGRAAQVRIGYRAVSRLA